MFPRVDARVFDLLRETWRPLAGLFVLDVLVTVAYVGLGWTWLTPRDLPLPVLGAGLGVFLGLRNNLAYARWWEARTLWGAIVNNSRNLARSAAMLTTDPASDGMARQLVLHQIAWVHALRCTLRRQDAAAEIAPFLPAATAARVGAAGNLPFAIQREMAAAIETEFRDGRIGPMEAVGLNTVLNALTDAQGGLERIRNTPLPSQYATFPRLFTGLYCLLLPFGIVPDLHLLTPIGSAAIGFLFLVLDASGRRLESPFAGTLHDVPMSAVTRTIETDMRDCLGDAVALPPMRPVDPALP